jgi:hypothetical protein
MRDRRHTAVRTRTALVAIAVALALAFTGCRTGGQVRWTSYDPALQPRIDVAATLKACRVLDGFRRFAEATSDAHEDATGYPNDALVGYIDDAQNRAGC